MRIGHGVLVMLSITLSGTAGAGEVPFATQQVISTAADAAESVFAADVDGDGDLDVLSASVGDDKIAWYENTDGAGSFGTQQVISSAADGADSVVAADVDGDGDMDVLSASRFDDKIAWYENTDGAGSFGTQQVISTAADAPFAVFAADLDGDGDLDVLSASSTDNEIAWYENTNGAGSFGTQQVISTAAAGAFSVFAADLDRDGDLDVLSASSADDKIAWYENTDGAGSFGTQQVISTAADAAFCVFAADVDGDGDADVLSASASDGKIAWYENTDGAGSFGIQQVISTAAQAARSVFAADVDGDGDVDVLSASAAGNKIAWYENADGIGSFSTERVISTAAASAFSVFAADVDGDGDTDVLSASLTDDKIAWYENQTIHRSAEYSADTQLIDGRGMRFVVAADVDGDGDADLVASAAMNSTHSFEQLLWLENTAGDASSFALHVIADPVPTVEQLVVVDIDGDGDLDVAAAASSNDEVSWFENDGTPASGSWASYVIDATSDGPIAVSAADLDRDGDLDLIATAGVEEALYWYENDGSPTSVPWTRRSLDASRSNAWSVMAGDVDGDGDLDVVGSALSNPELVWYENDGTPADGGFTEHVIPVGVYTNTRFIDLRDLDEDGDLDVVAPHRADGVYAWYENDGTPANGGWIERVLTSDAPGATHAVVTDLDADGDLDVLTASELDADAEVSWLENDGTPADGGWLHRPITASANGAIAVAPVDLDGDGDLDVASVGAHVNRLFWHENRGGQFALPTSDVSYQGMLDSQKREVLQIQSVHRGRAGDTDAELVSLELRLEDDQGAALNDTQAADLLAALDLHLDDGDGIFEDDPTDPRIVNLTSFSLTAGVLTIAFADADPAVQLEYGSPRSYFLVATLQGSASAATPSAFEVHHLTQSSSAGEDRDHDISLSLEHQVDVGTGVIVSLAPGSDFDADGLDNEVEASVHFSDPGNPDTDGDGLTDGDEVNIHLTDPLAPDSDSDGMDDAAEVLLGSDPLDEDTDDDSVCDGTNQVGACASAGDNCPLQSNAAQTNSDAFPAGDVCQCGNVDGSGGIDLTDVQRVREHVVGRSASGAFDLSFCDVHDDDGDGVDDCNVADIVFLRRAVAGHPTTLEDACDAYFTPVP